MSTTCVSITAPCLLPKSSPSTTPTKYEADENLGSLSYPHLREPKFLTGAVGSAHSNGIEKVVHQGKHNLVKLSFYTGAMAEINNVAAVLATKTVKGGGRTYFFDLRESKKGNKYVQVTESRRGQDGQNIRNTLFLFPDHAQEFQSALNEIIEQV